MKNGSAPGISVVGYACRLPGAASARAFWQLLDEGRCAVGTLPDDRFPFHMHYRPGRTERGKTYTLAAGTIGDVFGFDPAPFNLTPREAAQMDPQQRILLEVAFEALEHAGIAPSSLSGSATGVYVGASALDYGNRFLLDPARGDAYAATGNTLSIISNRLSYVLDLKGPSFTVDTACSSSLVALDAAVQALGEGRIDTAIVAGVNVLISPFGFISFSQAGMLSRQGLCRAFDAAGDGYVRAEGCVVMVLRRDDVARANGERPRAAILGSGVNQDGRTVGLSMPSADAQAKLLRQVYVASGISADHVAFIEAHGTGTRIGDPVEARAIGEVLGQERAAPLPIGSVKTNIGHTEPTSGLAGLLKAILALEHDRLPASLHFETPNPDIPFEALNIRVAATPMPLPRSGGRRIAGVNSFGFGGTNAHVIVADPEPVEPIETAATCTPCAPLTLSAAGEGALRALAGRWAERLAGMDEAAFRRLAAANGHRRDGLRHRLAACGDAASVRAALAAYAAGEPAPELVEGAAAAGRDVPVCFVFTGNGAQWPGMGRAAYAANAVFRARLEAIDAAFRPLAGWSIVEAMHTEDIETRLARTSVAQPMLFAIQLAVIEALAAFGIRPAAVIGHSVGEVAAAAASGALAFEDAVRVIHARSEHQEIARGAGTMAAVLISEEEARAALQDPDLSGLTLAAVNSPRAVTLSGPSEAIERLARRAGAERWAMRRLELDYPFHSPLIDAVREPFLGALAGFAPREARIPYVSSVTGTPVAGTALDADYWWRNVREPVRFADAVTAAAGLGARIFLEIGPRPVLLSFISDTLAARELAGVALATLERRETAGDPVERAALAAWCRGAAVDRPVLFGPRPPVDEDLPAYPWQRRRFLAEPTPEAVASADPAPVHPLLGLRPRSDGGSWFNHLDPAIVPWLADHRVGGEIVVPAAAFIEMLLAAARQHLSSDRVILRDLDVTDALRLDPDRTAEVLVRISSDGLAEILSRPRGQEDDWHRHASARIARLPADVEAPAARRGARGRRYSAETLYAAARACGLDFGPAFRRLREARRSGRGRITVALATPVDEAHGALYGLHPTVIDSAFHGLITLFADLDQGEGTRAYLPVRFGEIRLLAAGRRVARAELEVRRASPRELRVDIALIADGGEVVAVLREGRFRAATLQRRARLEDLAHRIVGLPAAAPGGRSEPSAAALAAVEKAAARLAGAREPEEGSLLIEAAARAIAHRTLAKLAAGGTLDPERLVEERKIAPERLGYVSLLADWLVRTGLATRETAAIRLAADTGLPEPETLIATLVAGHPRRIGEAAALARLARDLPGLLQTVESLRIEGETEPAREAVAEALAAIAESAAAAWDGPVLRILLCGAGDGVLARRLAALATVRPVRLAICDRDPRGEERARLAFHANPAVEVLAAGRVGAARCDLLILDASAPGVAAGLAELAGTVVPGGLLVGAGLEPSLARDLLCGIDPDWLDRPVAADFPLSGDLSREEWEQEVASLSFDLHSLDPLATPHAAAWLSLARAPAEAAPDRHETDTPGVVIVSLDAGHAPQDLAETLAARLEREGRPVVLRRPMAKANGLPKFDPLIVDDWAEALSAAGEGPAELVVLTGKSSASDSSALVVRLSSIASMMQAFVRGPAGVALRRIWLLVPGGSGLTASQHIVSCGLWAAARVAANEHGDLDLRLVDIAPTLPAEAAAARLCALLREGGEEREILITESGLQVLRVICGEAALPAPRRAAASPAGAATLAADGGLDRLRWRAAQRRAPGRGEVEIEVAATGLNFRDVMFALGLLPDEILEGGFAGPTIGLECAGTIAKVGEGVARLKPGDRVIAFAADAFSTHVTVPQQVVAPIPGGLDPAAAATVPVAFLTALYALEECARLRRGETVLIHGGAGGVGLAALQIAGRRGARVLATAGTAEKRALLLALGAEAVFDSRSLSFVDGVMTATGGQGVDVVLNSLAGEAMEASLSVLRPFGRFLELGKRDYAAGTRVGLRPLRRNIAYHGIDLDQLLASRGGVARRLILRLARGFAGGDFAPLPHRLFEAARSSEAFRLMQASGHIGKIVVTPPDPSAADPSPPPFAARADGTYVIVGGLGGFGLETARWLLARGARHLALLGRSGACGREADVAELEATGASVTVCAVDAADEAALGRVLDRIRATMPPIRGVIHAAMVLDDALFAHLSPERIAPVVQAKLAIASHLDRLTRADALDLFVLYSSATTLVGNPGQAAYVAANAAMEALARARRRAGLPALAVAWGAISDAGYLARNGGVNAALSRRLGRSALTAREALEALGSILARGDPSPEAASVAIARFDWSLVRSELPIAATPLFETVMRTVSAVPAEEERVDIARLIAGRPAREARDLVARLLAAEVARILRLPVADVPSARPLAEIGMDSLMGLELRTAVQQKFGIDVPIAAIADGATLADMAARLVARLGSQAVPDSAAVPDIAAEAMLARHLDQAPDPDELEPLRARFEERRRAVGRLTG